MNCLPLVYLGTASLPSDGLAKFYWEYSITSIKPVVMLTYYNARTCY
jgi:hypothetical protein